VADSSIDIIAQILIEGGSEAQAVLSGLGEAGKTAFDSIGTAAQGAVGALSSIGTGNLAAELSALGTAAQSALGILGNFAGGGFFADLAMEAGAAAVAVTGLVGALMTLAEKSAQAIKETTNLATMTGTSVEQMSGMTSTLASMGVNTDNLGIAFRRLAVFVETAWPQIQQSIAAASDTAASDMLKIREASDAVGEAAYKTAEDVRNAAHQMASDLLNLQKAQDTVSNSATSAASAQLNLAQAQDRLNVAKGGAPDESLKIKSAELAVEKAQQEIENQKLKAQQDELALAAAQQKVIDDRHKAAVQAEQDSIAQQKAALELSAAQRKASEDQLKDIGAIAAAITDLGKGGAISSGLDLASVSAVNLAKGVIAAAAAMNDGFKPNENQVLMALADTFHGMTDETEKSAIAVRLFGRSVSEDMVRALSLGSQAFKNYQAANAAAGLVITTNMSKVALAMAQSFNKITNDLGITIEQIGNLFGPAFTAGLTVLDNALRENHDAIMAWATSLASEVEPIVTDFFNILSGKQAVTAIGSVIQIIGSFFTALANDIIIPAIKIIDAGFQVLAAGINAVFGTDISARTLEFIAAIAIFTSIFGTIATVVGGAVAATLSWGAALIAVAPELLVIAGGVIVTIGAIAALTAACLALAYGIGVVLVQMGLMSQDTLDSWVKNVTDKITGLADKVKNIFSPAGGEKKTPVDDLKDSLDSLSSDTKKADSALGTTGDAVSSMADKFAAAKDKVAASMSGINASIGGVGPGAGAPAAGAGAGAGAPPPAEFSIGGGMPDTARGTTMAMLNMDDAMRRYAASLESTKKAQTDFIEGNQNIDKSMDPSGINAATQQIVTDYQKIDTAQKEVAPQGGVGGGPGDSVGQSAIDQALQGADQQAQKFGQQGDQSMQSVGDSVTTLAQDIQSQLNAALDSSIAKMQALAGAAAGAQAPNITPPDTSGLGYATGGPISGPGTSTSDSVVIRASRGEFMVRASAVSRVGVDFLHAINNGLIGLAGFASGGPISVGLPSIRAVGGGGPSTQHVLNLSIDGNQFNGLIAPPDTANSLKKFAIARQHSATGRKPGWYR
jgi:hypothetical protein